MFKIIILLFAGLIGNASFASDTLYYWQNPKVLVSVLSACPKVMDAAVSCDELAKIKAAFDAMGYDLQTNPQIFGKKILKLQQDITVAEQTIKNHPDDTAAKSDLIKKNEELAHRLAVAKWLESPVS